jgi:hypothetical protein
MWGVAGIDLDAEDAEHSGIAVSAPASGVQLGTGRQGPVTLRLFRLGGTRVVVAARLLPVQLIVLRTAAAGTPVQVVTSRPQLWEPLLRHDPRTHLVTAQEVRQPAGGPTLIVDDRPAEVRGPVEVGPWQCRVDVRSRWAGADLARFAQADLTIFGAVASVLTDTIGSAFSLGRRGADPLAELDDNSVGVLRRTRAEFVSLDTTRAEWQLLQQVGAGRRG